MDDVAQRRVLQGVVDRLVLEFSDLPEQAVRDEAAAVIEAFSDAPVRDYVAIFVRRATLARLRQTRQRTGDRTVDLTVSRRAQTAH